MNKLPLLKAREIGKILGELGFNLVHRKGSHMFYKHPDGRTTVIPDHRGEKVDRGLLNKIIKKDLDLTREEFLKQMKK